MNLYYQKFSSYPAIIISPNMEITARLLQGSHNTARGSKAFVRETESAAHYTHGNTFRFYAQKASVILFLKCSPDCPLNSL